MVDSVNCQDAHFNTRFGHISIPVMDKGYHGYMPGEIAKPDGRLNSDIFKS